MVSRRKELSAQRRFPTDPQGGDWESSAQPRLQFDTDCDERSGAAIEFLLHENTLGVSQQLMKAEHVVPHQFACICSGSHDAGPMHWHRDVGPGEPAPLRGMISNMGTPRAELSPVEYSPCMMIAYSGLSRAATAESILRQSTDNSQKIRLFHCRMEYLSN